ncbi:L-hydantoinase [Methanimicrococcus hongohii]|uniref:Dihydroorotase n=1 Tax=Methanimicrococcus hongohii TaxID=3028295 RepID=A0AA96V131_9EURY|nr:dihydroorotase [Methanimicrococcus sp. Hf6]WNY24404.1 L-hydantoinase [Methanimicrococcus sp. Hf6]
MPDVLIQNARVLDGGQLVPAEILIEDGKIKGIAKEFRISSYDELINAKNAVVIPAGIDGHVHFRDPGLTYKEDWYSGSCSAAAGGITTVLEHPNTIPPVIDKAGFSVKLKRAQKRSVIDFGINGGVTNNIDKLKEIWRLGISVFGEIFMAESTGGLNISNNMLGDALSEIGEMDALACIHAEDEALRLINEGILKNDTGIDVHSRIRPNECEEIAVHDCIRINKEAAVSSRLHFCHTSTPEAVSLIAKAQKEFSSAGAGNAGKITCEVAPHHLFLSTKDYARLGTLGKMNPPLRSSDDAAYMIRALNSGLINAVASDHAPHMQYEKDVPMRSAPSGVPGVETLMPLMLASVRKNMLSLERVVQVTSFNPARIFGLDRLGKGSMDEGYDADLLFFDPKNVVPIQSKNLHTRCDWTPYEGMDGIFPSMTLSRGDVIWDGYQVVAKKGRGQFLPGAGLQTDEDGKPITVFDDDDDEE